jgi:hypothetical protein
LLDAAIFTATLASMKPLHGISRPGSSIPVKEPAMRKVLAIIAAVVLFAPVAYAAAYQAALIVA